MFLQRDLREIPQPLRHPGHEIVQRGRVGEGGVLALLNGLGGGGITPEPPDDGGDAKGDRGQCGESREAADRLHYGAGRQRESRAMLTFHDLVARAMMVGGGNAGL